MKLPLAIALTAALQAAALSAEITAGPMIGDTGPRESRVWVQTDVPASFQVRYWPLEGGAAGARLSALGHTSEERFLTGSVLLPDLTPGTRYAYQLLLDGQPLNRRYNLGFTTAPEFTPTQTALPELRILLGSCYYLDDPLMKVLNISYGTGMEIFPTMAKAGGDLMLWLGDNIYFAPFDLSNRYNMNQRYVKQRSAPELQPLLGAMPQYAIWDDHDFGPNNSDRHFAGKHDTLDLFRAYWLNPSSQNLSAEGTFFNKPWGDVEIFATDDRYHRDPAEEPIPDKSFFGREQLDWLKQRLKQSKATFKLVAIGSPVLNRHYVESFYLTGAEYRELTEFLASEKIEGVVFLSGDLHLTMLTRMDRPGAYPLYEYTNSPLTSNPTTSLGPELAKDDWIVPDSLVLERNFGRIRVHGRRGARVLTLETLDPKGKLIWKYDIPERELRYPAQTPGS